MCSDCFCEGCLIPINDEVSPVFAEGRDFTLAINWKPVTFDTCVNRELISSMELTESAKLAKTEKEGTRQIPVQDCLKIFTKNEKLSENDSRYCPQCQTHRQAFKKIDLWKLPQVLLIHLKRFTQSREKMTHLVKYPLSNFSLAEFVINAVEKNTTYRLAGVIAHTGSLGGGHYTAYGYNSQQWFLFNDATVAPVNEEQVVTHNAYVLFYLKDNKEETKEQTE